MHRDKKKNYFYKLQSAMMLSTARIIYHSVVYLSIAFFSKFPPFLYSISSLTVLYHWTRKNRHIEVERTILSKTFPKCYPQCTFQSHTGLHDSNFCYLDYGVVKSYNGAQKRHALKLNLLSVRIIFDSLFILAIEALLWIIGDTALKTRMPYKKWLGMPVCAPRQSQTVQFRLFTTIQLKILAQE